MKLLNITGLLSLKLRGFEQDIHSLLEILSFVCYKPDTCIKYKPVLQKIWIFPQEISVNLSIKYIGMLSDISTDPYLPGSNKYTKALIYLCLTNTANTLGCQFACV